MAITTPNLGLVKDAPGEFYDVNKVNANLDKIDGMALVIGPIINAFWKKIQSYETAGSFNWTAPDLFNGKPYKIGVMIIGAGASGASAQDNNASEVALGGASGRATYLVKTVTPGSVHALVVGRKGLGATQSNVTQMWAVPGNNGGSSSFDGVVAKGGEGGKMLTTGVIPLGAQCPSDRLEDNPFGGLLMGKASPFTVSGFPNECFNPFESSLQLAAGGPGKMKDATTGQTCIGGLSPITGLGGGSGVSAYNLGAALTANDATAPGCGGGGCLIRYYSFSGSLKGTTSGAGADGAVYVYVQGVAS